MKLVVELVQQTSLKSFMLCREATILQFDYDKNVNDLSDCICVICLIKTNMISFISPANRKMT